MRGGCGLKVLSYDTMLLSVALLGGVADSTVTGMKNGAIYIFNSYVGYELPRFKLSFKITSRRAKFPLCSR